MQIQDDFLHQLQDECTPVACFLINGVKLEGSILSFDQFSLVLGSKAASPQLIMKSAVSTILPQGKSFKFTAPQ